MVSFLYLLLVGLTAGFIGSLIGIGGGIIIVPMLTLLLGIPIHYAIGTSIIAVLATSISGSRRYIIKEITNIKLGLSLETFTAAGGIVGGITAAYLKSNILYGLFGAFMLITTAIIYKKNKTNRGKDKIYQAKNPSLYSSYYINGSNNKKVDYDVRNVPLGFGATFFAGITSGLLGIGGGAIKVPTLNLLMDVPLKATTATSNYMIGITAAASSIIYFANGFIDPFISSAVVVGVLAGGTLGSFAAGKAKTITIAKIMIGIFIIIGINMLLKAFGISLY